MDDTTLSFLKIFNERQSLNLVQLAAILNLDSVSLADPINYMLKQNYLRINDFVENDCLTLHAQLEITYYGKTELIKANKQKRQLRYTEIRAWITAAIAVAAFIKGFFF